MSEASAIFWESFCPLFPLLLQSLACNVSSPLQLLHPSLLEGTTAPPGPISESELISAMETHGIGTDASIASHIGTIEARKYVRLVGGRRFEPTPLGLALIQGIERIDPELVLPTGKCDCRL